MTHAGTGAMVWPLPVRIIQGTAIGADNPTAAAHVTETAPPPHRMLYNGISYGGVILGTVLCHPVPAALLAHLGPQGLKEGGRRIAFAVGGLLGFTALLVRRRAAESPEFLHHTHAQDGKRPGSRPWRTVRRNTTAVFPMTTGLTSGYHLTLTCLPQYVRHTQARPTHRAPPRWSHRC